MSTHVSETIVAIATPPGRGGIGIVRLSGAEALAVASPLLRFRGELEPQRTRFCEVVDPESGGRGEGEKLDEAVVTYYKSPRSYTGEDVVEIACHGAPVLLEFVLRQCVARGARLAAPGEFTERAFLSGRMDLTQAEAVRDLIDAQTLYQARVAASQMGGAVSRRVVPIKTALIELIAQIEAGIDFAEDDTPVLTPGQIVAMAEPIADQLASLARSFEHGRLVHQGFSLAIVGEPNVGKSSLFNALVERERAIVTATPGTTRDLVTERISLAGLPLELIDTAGLRTGTPSGPLDEAERLGIEKSRQALADADLVLIVVDATTVLIPEQWPGLGPGPGPQVVVPEQTRAMLALIAGRPCVLVMNKADLLPEMRFETKLVRVESERADGAAGKLAVVLTSARNGEGLADLRRAITEHLQPAEASQSSGMLTTLRQHQAVTLAAEAVARAMKAAPADTPHEMVLLDLYAALGGLDSLTGVTTADDILGLIFSTFCIGK